jgi:hypothetical protein
MLRRFGCGFLLYVLSACLEAAVGLAADLPVRVECSLDLYSYGELVVFTWTNDSDSTVVAGNNPPYNIYDATTGELVCQVTLPLEYPLAPHSSVVLNWDQSSCSQPQVPPGRYLVRVYYAINDHPPVYMVEDGFMIDSPCAVPDRGTDGRLATRLATWGQIKSTYR